VLVLSDGITTTGTPPVRAAEAARQLGVHVSTVALGTPTGVYVDSRGRRIPVPPDPDTLQRVAQITGGHFSTAASAADLAAVYRSLASDVRSVRERQEITVLGLAGALLLVTAGAMLALLLLNRVP
jgi:Ca-activated chloride channel family protein